MIETTVSQRRGLDSERQQKETEDQRRAREVELITEPYFTSLIISIGSGGQKISFGERNLNYSQGLLLHPM